MSRTSGNATGVEIFLWDFDECSKRFRWKLATIGSFFIVSCFVDSWYALHVEHFIFADEPRCSGFVKRSRQLCREMGPLEDEESTVGRSREMSQNGSIVVETFLQD